MKIKMLIASFLILGIMFCSVTPANAQGKIPYKITKTGAAVVNTGTIDITYTTGVAVDRISFQPVITKVSGTVAGTVVLYASNDGTNYKSLGDTLTLANQTTNHIVWSKQSDYSYYLIRSTGSGTMNATPAVFIRVVK